MFLTARFLMLDLRKIFHAQQREVDTMHFMQTAPWLGFLPGADGQILYSQDGGDSPIVNLFKSATATIVANPSCPHPASFQTLSKQAEAAGTQLHILLSYFDTMPFICRYNRTHTSSIIYNIQITPLSVRSQIYAV